MRAREAPSFFGRTRRRSVRRTAPGRAARHAPRPKARFFKKGRRAVSKLSGRIGCLYRLRQESASGVARAVSMASSGARVPVTTSLTEANRTPRAVWFSASCTALAMPVLPLNMVTAAACRLSVSAASGRPDFSAVGAPPANLLTISSVVMYSTNWTAASRFSGSLQAFSVM